jgi:hypothetical protein
MLAHGAFLRWPPWVKPAHRKNAPSRFSTLNPVRIGRSGEGAVVLDALVRVSAGSAA